MIQDEKFSDQGHKIWINGLTFTKAKAMRNIFFTALLFSVWCFSGCSKWKTDEVNVTISNSRIFHYDFGACGDEEGAYIITQGTHFEISEIVRDSTTAFCPVFEYKPAAGFTGTDIVEVETNTGSNGAGNGRINTIQFNFTITN